jgi:hypothetical protein
VTIVFPVRLDRPVFAVNQLTTPINAINAADDFMFVDSGGIHIQVNGRDSSNENENRGTRLTNLAGIQGGELMKVCPWCDRTKRHNEYGDHGRTTNEYRDQSNCTDCRNRY